MASRFGTCIELLYEDVAKSSYEAFDIPAFAWACLISHYTTYITVVCSCYFETDVCIIGSIGEKGN